MNTLRMLSAGMLLAAAAAAAMAAEDASAPAAVPTVVVTAKRHVLVPVAEAPREIVQISVVLPTDMPEAEIDYHLTPVATPPAPAVERATL